jgi:hypothetical protein
MHVAGCVDNWFPILIDVDCAREMKANRASSHGRSAELKSERSKDGIWASCGFLSATSENRLFEPLFVAFLHNSRSQLNGRKQPEQGEQACMNDPTATDNVTLLRTRQTI